MRAALALLAILFASPALAQIITIAEIQRGTMVTISGTVDKVMDDDEFILADETGNIPVYFSSSTPPVELGEPVTVHGYVDDELVLELYAHEITRADGTVLQVGQRYH
ncbi:hypothetical protein [Pontivivens ytuae]|uniref:Bacterial OB-fold domain-containing protein n=1 Tax=Pontivivens ytuae TaxID=2789856 RepID=A0A7S9QCW0_9RHOB|nr:hypothetical protein [Pontivivens ytuae]QPH53767.1 hypothetical protein I0K15_18625 [Pontivivens ytuae]